MAHSMLDPTTGGNQFLLMDFNRQWFLTTYPLRDYDWDVWIQDDLSFRVNSPDSQVMSLSIQFVTEVWMIFQRTTFISRYHHRNLGFCLGNSQDSFGLEASPPITVDGIEYPFGQHITENGGATCRWLI